MAEPLLCKAETVYGPMRFYGNGDPRDHAGTTHPIVLLLHGALQHSHHNTLSWFDVLIEAGFDAICLDLPGHGRSPENGPPSFQGFAHRVRDFLSNYFYGRQIVVIGESLGGLIALQLSDGSYPDIKAVLVADPPLTMAKQWVCYGNITKPQKPHTPFMQAYVDDVFGYAGDELEERIYYDLLLKTTVPTLLLTGTVPLFPVRPMRPIMPCCIDAVDLAIIKGWRHPRVRIVIEEGAGHRCLDAERPKVRETVLEFCAAHVQSAAKGAAATAAMAGADL